MSRANLRKSKTFKISRFLLIFSLTFYWIFSGSPQIWQNPPIPPKIQKAQATFSSPTAMGSTSTNVSFTTLDVTPTANITVGKIAFFTCVTDNSATANGASDNHDSVTDTDGHTWTEVFEETDSDGAAADGSTTSLWWTKVTTQIDTTDSVTLTIDFSSSDGICALTEVTIGAGKTVAYSADTPTHADSGTSLSETRSGLTSREYLFFGLFGAEGEDTTKTAIANYSELHDLVSTTSGLPATNVQMHVGTRILTGTGDTWTSSAVTFTNGIQSLTMFYEVASAAPTVTVNQPDGISDEIAEGANFTVNYDLADTDDTVTANFAYDADAADYNGTLITGCINKAEGLGATCIWDTTGVSPGTYYIHGTTTDGTTAAQDYSDGVVTINDAPELNVDEPDGVGDTVTVGDNYNIQYDLADTDNVVTAAFYYDTDTDMTGGQAISGACASAGEGTNATCSWNTTGVTPANYYVYGVTNDGFTEVKDLSGGQITILSSNTAPTGSFNSASQKTDGSGDVDISLEVDDGEDNDTKAKIAYEADNTCDSFGDLTLDESAGATADYNDSGGTPSVENDDAYQVGTLADRRIITSSGSNTVAFVWNSATEQSSGNTTMCLQLTVNDDTVDQTTPDTQTLVIDNVDPSPAPGNLTENNRRATQITLNYGTASNDTNDPGTNNYRLFYKAGTSGVAETDTEKDSADFDAWNYGGSSSITITGLNANADYVFNIWAYDTYCQTSIASCTQNKTAASEITLKTRTGLLDTTASSSQSFDSLIDFSFNAQTSTMSNAGAIQIIDDRGTNAGWTLNLTATDWKSGEDVMQLDYDDTGSDDNLGKLCAFPAEANLSAESGSLTGVSLQGDACFSAGVQAIDLVAASDPNGTGTYWLTDMSLEQYIPSSPTAEVYTTTIIYTIL